MKKQATYGNYTVIVNDDNSVTVKNNGKECEVAKDALREISASAKFKIDADWNTRQLGLKLVDFLNENKPAAKAAAPQKIISYTKLKITYYTDGVNTRSYVNTRQGDKYKTLSLPQKVQEFGDRNGYGSISIDYSLDHLILKGHGEVLMDIDINGTNNNEYIRGIVSYEWLP